MSRWPLPFKILQVSDVKGRSGEIVQHVLDTLLAVQLALHTLENAATSVMDVFQPHWLNKLPTFCISMAKKRCLPFCQSWRLERRAEAKVAEGCKHAVGVCDDRRKAGGEDDGAAVAADGVHIRAFQLQTRCGRLRQLGWCH